MQEQEHGTPGGSLRTLPGDDVRSVMWRISDRFDLQMLVQSARGVARGPVAQLVAAGARNTHEWTDTKNSLLSAFDDAGITAVYMDPDQGGYIDGPKNFALALVAFELAWVDAGAATGSLAGALALAPIHERGTPEQQAFYMSKAAPPLPGEDRKAWRGAFALTEPLPYVGVETGILSGRVSVAEWKEGEEPILQVEKRGRFITNMGFANFVTAAVDSRDSRIKGSCMVIIEQGDPGVFDRGVPTRKLVHQLSSTRDPVLAARVPASRIIGGYTVSDGVIVPRFTHGEVIEAVFRRTRVTVGLMTAAKLLSAVEPVIRYQRGRFRGGESATPGSPRHELGLQLKEDPLHRLVDVWATGEAAASLGFASARLFDALDPLEREKERILAERGIAPGRAQLRALAQVEKRALDCVRIASSPPDSGRQEAAQACDAPESDPLVRFCLLDSVANVFCPATKLWNTGHGATVLRDAVSLMGGYGITEDCPGFLGHKWMDSQLEATYEGPEAVQRRQLSVTMANELFLAQFSCWIEETAAIATREPRTGASALAAGMDLWLWTLNYLRDAKDPHGVKLFSSSRQGVTFPLADALGWLVAARCQLLDLLELQEKGPDNPVVAEGLSGLAGFLADLCHVQSAAAAGEVGRVCAELVYGYMEDDGQTAAECCPCHGESGPQTDSQISLSQSSALALAAFASLRLRLDQSIRGARLAKDRAAQAISEVMIPEALDYPR